MNLKCLLLLLFCISSSSMHCMEKSSKAVSLPAVFKKTHNDLLLLKKFEIQQAKTEKPIISIDPRPGSLLYYADAHNNKEAVAMLKRYGNRMDVQNSHNSSVKDLVEESFLKVFDDKEKDGPELFESKKAVLINILRKDRTSRGMARHYASSRGYIAHFIKNIRFNPASKVRLLDNFLDANIDQHPDRFPFLAIFASMVYIYGDQSAIENTNPIFLLFGFDAKKYQQLETFKQTAQSLSKPIKYDDPTLYEHNLKHLYNVLNMQLDIKGINECIKDTIVALLLDAINTLKTKNWLEILNNNDIFPNDIFPDNVFSQAKNTLISYLLINSYNIDHERNKQLEEKYACTLKRIDHDDSLKQYYVFKILEKMSINNVNNIEEIDLAEILLHASEKSDPPTGLLVCINNKIHPSCLLQGVKIGQGDIDKAVERIAKNCDSELLKNNLEFYLTFYHHYPARSPQHASEKSQLFGNILLRKSLGDTDTFKKLLEQNIKPSYVTVTEACQEIHIRKFSEESQKIRIQNLKALIDAGIDFNNNSYVSLMANKISTEDLPSIYNRIHEKQQENKTIPADDIEQATKILTNKKILNDNNMIININHRNAVIERNVIKTFLLTLNRYQKKNNFKIPKPILTTILKLACNNDIAKAINKYQKTNHRIAEAIRILHTGYFTKEHL